MPVTTKMSYPRAPSSIGDARRSVRHELEDVLEGRIDDAVLLASEAMANAVEHSSADTIDVAFVLGTACVRIEVGTPGGGHWGRGPELCAPGLGDATGRGLFLIDELSDSWGTRASDSTLCRAGGGQRSAPALASRSRVEPPCQSKQRTVASSRSSPPQACTTVRVSS